MPETGGDVAQMNHAERAALVILDCIRRVKIKVGRGKLAQILHGSKAQDILNFHHDKNIYYGRLAAVKQSDIEELIGQLADMGYIKIIGGEYPTLALTPRGENAIQQKESITLRLPKSLKTSEVLHAKAKLSAGGTVEYTAQLLTEGLTPEKVAHQRNLTLMTIYGHCAKLIEAGKLDVNKVVAKAVQEKIRKAIENAGSTQYLAPIKNRLPDEITFEMIRCVVAADSHATRSTQHAASSTPHEPNSTPDSISAYLSSPHPRPLKGNWSSGFALDFHSAYRGADWNRSGIGDLTFRLKYQADASVLPALIDHTRQMFAARPEMNQFDAILPVPSSTQREFSPVHEFCKALSQACHKPVLPAVVKTRQTKPQKEMQTLVQKRDNVAGAFAVSGDVSGKKVLVVDDLFDSGATLEEITKTLLKCKAARVDVLTLTRTIHSDS
jgi:adenine/guanine phosphoribosyltransferase-like PRPP-binding protein